MFQAFNPDGLGFDFPSTCSWVKPPADSFKVYADALGVLLEIRLVSGLWSLQVVVVAVIFSRPNCLLSRKVLRIVWDIRLPPVLIESDSTKAIELIKDCSNVNHRLYAVVVECRVLMHNPWSCSIQHVPSNAICVQIVLLEGHVLPPVVSVSVFDFPSPFVGELLLADATAV